MTEWSTLIGHEQVRRWFATSIAKGRMGGSFLLVGNPGIGKRTVAYLLARTLLCETRPPSQMQPCGNCQACVQVIAQSHPDLIRVTKPAEKTFIPLEALVGSAEARMQEGFCRDVRLKPYRGNRKVAIIEDADYLNEEGANCLLKTLEEPPANAVIFLIGTSEQRQLPTIRSRCQTIRLMSPRGQDAVRFLRQVHQIEASEEQIADAVATAGGDMHLAAGLLSGEADQLRDAIRSQLNAAYPDPVALNRIITSHVNEAGKEANKRRSAMRHVFSMAVQHYRRQLRDDATHRTVHPLTLSRLDRSLRALREVDRSANQATLIECYAVDIAAGTTGDRGEIGS